MELRNSWTVNGTILYLPYFFDTRNIYKICIYPISGPHSTNLNSNKPKFLTPTSVADRKYDFQFY